MTKADLPERPSNVMLFRKSLPSGMESPHNGGGGGDDMERRVTRLEEAVIAIKGDLSDIRASQATLLERMDRVMDKVRDMPSERRVSEMLNAKLTLAATILAAVIGILAYISSLGGAP